MIRGNPSKLNLTNTHSTLSQWYDAHPSNRPEPPHAHSPMFQYNDNDALNSIGFPKIGHNVESCGVATIDSMIFNAVFTWKGGCTRFESPSNVNPLCGWIRKDYSMLQDLVMADTIVNAKDCMLCTITPKTLNDHKAYKQFCSFYKSIKKLAVTACYPFLFYVCPPDEPIFIDKKCIKKVFNCTIPRNVLWCIIFTKNHQNEKL